MELNVKKLISHRFDILDAKKAYDIVGGLEKSLGILITYPGIKIDKSKKVKFKLH